MFSHLQAPASQVHCHLVLLLASPPRPFRPAAACCRRRRPKPSRRQGGTSSSIIACRRSRRRRPNPSRRQAGTSSITQPTLVEAQERQEVGMPVKVREAAQAAEVVLERLPAAFEEEGVVVRGQRLELLGGECREGGSEVVRVKKAADLCGLLDRRSRNGGVLGWWSEPSASGGSSSIDLPIHSGSRPRPMPCFYLSSTNLRVQSFELLEPPLHHPPALGPSPIPMRSTIPKPGHAGRHHGVEGRHLVGHRGRMLLQEAGASVDGLKGHRGDLGLAPRPAPTGGPRLRTGVGGAVARVVGVV